MHRCFASDDFVRGQSFRGFKVKTFSQVQAQFGDITVVLGFGTSLPEIMERIDNIEKKLRGHSAGNVRCRR